MWSSPSGSESGGARSAHVGARHRTAARFRAAWIDRVRVHARRLPQRRGQPFAAVTGRETGTPRRSDTARRDTPPRVSGRRGYCQERSGTPRQRGAPAAAHVHMCGWGDAEEPLSPRLTPLPAPGSARHASRPPAGGPWLTSRKLRRRFAVRADNYPRPGHDTATALPRHDTQRHSIAADQGTLAAIVRVCRIPACHELITRCDSIHGGSDPEM